jgi:conjugative relaxase-like TrwC/TraI family protein
MLSRGKVTPLTVSYYTDTVATGLDDYYAGHGEEPGRWVGRGSAAAGLRGEVSAEALARLFDGRHPLSGQFLGEPYRVRVGADRVTGWDLTFSAPKSVSTLWATAGGKVGMAVREGHDAAVATGLAYLEDHAAFSRQGKAGVRQVDTEGLLATAFVHRASRAGDPQLHTHVLVSGRVRCVDRVWRALDSRAVHRELKTAGMVYQAALRAELTARLGVEWAGVDRHGQAELVGVPAGLRERFSQRAAAVEARAGELIAEAEASLGRELTAKGRRRIYKVAVLETRTAKDTAGGADEGLFDRWRADAVAAGWDPDRWIGDVVERRALPAPRQPMTADEVLEDLSRSLSTWSRRDAVRATARLAPPGLGDAAATRRWIEATADEVLAHPAVVRLAAPEPAPPADLRRRDGLSVFERPLFPSHNTHPRYPLGSGSACVVHLRRRAFCVALDQRSQRCRSARSGADRVCDALADRQICVRRVTLTHWVGEPRTVPGYQPSPAPHGGSGLVGDGQCFEREIAGCLDLGPRRRRRLTIEQILLVALEEHRVTALSALGGRHRNRVERQRGEAGDLTRLRLGAGVDLLEPLVELLLDLVEVRLIDLHVERVALDHDPVVIVECE